MNCISATRGAYREMADDSLEVKIIIEPRDIPEFHRLFREKGMLLAIAPLATKFQPPEVATGWIPEPNTWTCTTAGVGGENTATGTGNVTPDEITGKEEKLKGGSLCRWAAMRGNENSFYEFIRPIYDRHMGGTGTGTGDIVIGRDVVGIPAFCRHAIMVICNIKSRTELDHNREAAQKFHTMIREPYIKWLEVAVPKTNVPIDFPVD